MKKVYPERMNLNEVWQHFVDAGLVHLSTIDGDQPRVRMMALTVYHNNLWVVTRTADDKVEQIRRNNNIEFTCTVQGNEKVGCLRATARAEIITDKSTREDVANFIPWFTSYWKSSEDPNYTLIRLDLKRILFDHHENALKYDINL
jgi:general stress protein 26